MEHEPDVELAEFDTTKYDTIRLDAPGTKHFVTAGVAVFRFIRRPEYSVSLMVMAFNIQSGKPMLTALATFVVTCAIISAVSAGCRMAIRGIHAIVARRSE